MLGDCSVKRSPLDMAIPSRYRLRAARRRVYDTAKHGETNGDG